MNIALVQPTLIGAHATATPSTAAALEKPTGATGIVLGALTADVYYTLDGTTPTASNGFVIKTAVEPQWVNLPVNATVTVFSASGKVVYQWFKV